MNSDSAPSPQGKRILHRSPRRIRWGIIGTGGIARTFARGVAASQAGVVVAVGSRELSSARTFAEANGPFRAFGRYEDLLADPEVEAVYIATPHPSHCEWTLKAANAGKHILCEKPIGMNTREAESMFAAARSADVLLMEAFMYRCHPQTAKVVEMIRSGELGTIGSVQATFSFINPEDLSSRWWSRELGGGGILDVGCYPVSFARLVAGAAAGSSFLDPTDVRAVGRLHPTTQIDVYTAAVLRFETGMIAQVATGVGLYQDSSVRIFGSRGWLHVVEPWLPGTVGRPCRVVLYREGQVLQEVPIVSDQPIYALEADAFALALFEGKRAVPEMSPDDTLGNMRTLDRWRAEVGLTYPADEDK